MEADRFSGKAEKETEKRRKNIVKKLSKGGLGSIRTGLSAEAPFNKPRPAVELGSIRGEPGHEYRVLRGSVRPVDLLGRSNEPRVTVTRAPRLETPEVESPEVVHIEPYSNEEYAAVLARARYNAINPYYAEAARTVAEAKLMADAFDQKYGLMEGDQTTILGAMVMNHFEQIEYEREL